MKRAPDLSIALIGGPHRDADDGEESEDAASHDDAKDAMDAFIEAIHAKDVDGALQAYDALCDLQAARGEEDEDGGAEEEARA